MDNIVQNVNEKTTIQVLKLVKITLALLKKNKRETYNQVLRRILKPDVYFKIDYRWKWESDEKESTHPVRVIGINKPDEKNNLIKPNEIVISDNEIYILFDYPLENYVLIKFKSKTRNGFTRLYLWQCVYDGYKKIYDNEEKTSTIEVVSMESIEKSEEQSRELLCSNKTQTNGIYGIFGHRIKYLWIEGVHYCTKTKIVELDIGS